MTDLVSDTWVFNGTSGEWNNTYSPNNPPARSMPYLAYDIESDMTIMFGGVIPALDQVFGDTWAYNYTLNPPSVPNPPRNLNAYQNADGPRLTWEAPVPISGVEILGYNVYQGDESGVYELVAELGNVLTYTDRSAGYGIMYYYAATAVSVSGESLYSNEDSTGIALSPYDDGIHTFIAYGDTRSSDETAVAAIHDDLVSIYLQRFLIFQLVLQHLQN